MRALLPILFIILVVSCAVGFVLQHAFLSQLRARHAQTWEALGRPTLFLNNSISNSLAVLRFLWRREYRGLADEQFVRFAAFLRCYLAAYVVLLALVVAVFVVSIRSK
jgi:hypothetical protein